MPKNQTTVAKKARAAARDGGVKYTEALAVIEAAAGGPEFCPDCGGPIICPECPGCACYNGQCTGWRHWGSDDFQMPGDEPRRDLCAECGADYRNGYGCDCD